MVVLLVLVLSVLSVRGQREFGLLHTTCRAHRARRKTECPGLVGLGEWLDVPAMSYKVDRFEGRKVITRSGMIHIFSQFAGNPRLHRLQGVISLHLSQAVEPQR